VSLKIGTSVKCLVYLRQIPASNLFKLNQMAWVPNTPGFPGRPPLGQR
jgi:hypothetical protein